MAPAKPSNKRPRQSFKQANAFGYAKRQSRKAKSRTSIDDVYEYEPGKSRRSNVRLELDKDESKEYDIGSDGEIGDGVNKEALRARLVGEREDDEGVANNDDEEIDSDGAFEESDEERFAEFFSRKKSEGKEKPHKGKAVRFADVDLNEEEGQSRNDEDEVDDEDEDEETEDEDGEFISLVDVLDGKADADMGDDESITLNSLTKASKSAPESVVEGEDVDEESEGVEEEFSSADEEKLDFTPSDDEAAPEALDELGNFITSLETSDKKRKDHPDSNAPTSQQPKRKKRQIIRERTEAGTENEFRAQASGSKLQLEDLLASLTPQSSTLQGLKKSTKALSSTSSKYAKTVSAPLPQRSQERLDREAAYEQTKEEVDKWRDTMKRIREAEHLSFPLQGGSSNDRSSTLELAAKFKPSNEFESSVDALLRAANMRDESDLAQAEDQMLLANNLTLEEVGERRAELRTMRELTFRAELKARRINKIKSKTYRRLKRREKEKLTNLSRNDAEEEGEDERMKRERARAMERATLRHKHTGKWAQQMKARGDHVGEDERREMEEMLTRGEKLRRKIQGAKSDESDDEEEESDEEGGDTALETLRQSAFDELQRVNEQDEQLEKALDPGKRSVFNMKFMKEAMAREKAKTDKMADDFLKELGVANEAADDGESDPNGAQEDALSGVITERVGGRLVFRPSAQITTLRPSRSLASDTSSVTLKSADLPSPLSSSENAKHGSSATLPISTPGAGSSTEGSNPWLTRPEAMELTAKSSRKNEAAVSKDSKGAEKSKNKLRKLASKRGEEQGKAKDDAKLVIETGKVLTLSNSVTVSGTKSSSKSSVSVTPRSGERSKRPSETETNVETKGVTTEDAGDIGDDSDADSEIEAQERALEAKTRGVKAFQQRDLVALAFAGDNVVQQFEETKLREISADAPKEVDTTIPGWGTWGGMGTRKAPPKASRIKKIPGIDPTTRADYNKNHVIISERRDKKAAKYMVKDLPFPYTSKAQFERSIQNPLGAEWNTRVGFQRATLPRVVTKPGVIITPLRKFS